MNSFIHNAGHELKTPISIIDSNIQIIKDIKKYNEPMMDEMKNETKKLNLLIDSLIKLSDI
jgi:signal transduction histidine kinase